jgi:hypothetical protein
VWSCNSTFPHAFITCCLIERRDTFTCAFYITTSL